MFNELGDNDPKFFITQDYHGENTHKDGYDFLLKRKIFFHDQEPILFSNFYNNWIDTIFYHNKLDTNHLLSNSEKNSIEKDMLLEKSGWHDFYWFSNGFLSLEWYRFYQYATYLENNWHPTKRFSSYNRILPNREHRLIISGYLAERFKENIILSCHSNNNITVEKKLPDNHQKYAELIKENLFVNVQNLVSDNFSHTINTNDFIDSFCHIITERIFYEDRIHLTEKTFRPIVCCRPFILASSPGALGYLKDYGFKTFDKFWSEDYDLIKDHNHRLDAILDIIKFIGSLDTNKMLEMLNEMKDILLFNRNHFYNTFRQNITNELWTNLNYASSCKNNIDCYFDQILNSFNNDEINFIKSYPTISHFTDMKAIDVYKYSVANIIGTTNSHGIRSYIKDNAEHYVSLYNGSKYAKNYNKSSSL